MTARHRTIQVTPAGREYLRQQAATQTGWDSFGVPLRREIVDRLALIFGALKAIGPIEGADQVPVTRGIIASGLSHVITRWAMSGTPEALAGELDVALFGEVAR